MKTCRYPTCPKDGIAQGFCLPHYRHAAKIGLIEITPRKIRTTEIRKIVPQWIREFEDGDMLREIAKRHEVHAQTVGQYLRKAGIDTSRNQPQIKKATEHGRPAMWQKCRCDTCKTARLKYRREELQKARERRDFKNITHGTSHGSAIGCPCSKCRAFAKNQGEARQESTRKTARRHMARWTPEQVYAAADLDRPIADIAKEIGRTYAAVSNVRKALDDPHSDAHRRYWELLQIAREDRGE